MNVLILGTFDGVHIAHRQLITEAKKAGNNIIACTFTSPFSKQKQLTDINEKIFLLKKYGVTEVFIEDFENIKDLSPEEYIKGLCEKFKPAKIVTGFNHSFGKNASGNPMVLSKLGKKYNFIPVTVPPVKEDDIIVSSTQIRSLLLNGETEKAAKLLDRCYSLKGKTVHGRSIGKSLDFPTINTEVNKNKLIPQEGVYATFVKVLGRTFKGMTNIGTNPTVTDENKISVETHILGFNEDIYNKTAEIIFVKKIRDDKKFENIEQLKDQLSFDAFLINAFLDTRKIN